MPLAEQTRQDWITEDHKKTQNTINLLTSTNIENKKEGMLLVAGLLPFLLLGGFSEKEIITYLEAKKHAAETVLKALLDKQSEEDSQVTIKKQGNNSVENSQEIKNEEPKKNT